MLGFDSKWIIAAPLALSSTMLSEGSLSGSPFWKLPYLSRHSGVTFRGGPSITVSMNEITRIGVYLTRLIDVLSAALDSGVAISIIAIFFW